MKSKFFSPMWRVAIALVMVLSLGLVMAAPATSATSDPIGLSFETSGGSVTAEWSTAKAGETDAMGDYSAELHAGFGVGDWAEVVIIPPTGITLDDMATITTGWSWWYYISTLGNRGTSLELHFEGPDDGYAEMTIMDKAYGSQPLGPPTLDAWTEQTIISSTTTGLVFGTQEDNTPIDEYPVGHEGTIADLVAYMIAQETVGDAGAWELVEVRPALGWIGVAETTAYVDDITFAGTTYELEPIAFDATAYNTGDTVDVTVCNSNESGTIGILAKADTLGADGKISVALNETGTGTGVFTGSFKLVSTTPGTGELLVNDGDSVDVYYNGDWGAGAQLLDWSDPPSASVDDIAPEITIVLPAESANITDATPDIEATLTDASSGIDEDTIVMKLDDVDPPVVAIPATDYTYNSGTGALSFTPDASLTYETLTDGDWYVTVDVSDLAGNAATQASWSFTVDTEVPVITDEEAAPPVILPDDETEVTFSANVTDATSGIDSVEIDLSDIGGSATEAMLDDGVAPDATAGDGIYTASANITVVAEDDYDELTITAADNAGNSAVPVELSLGVWSDIVPPVIADPAITYTYGSSARPDDTVTISANVTDDIGMGIVSAACDATPDVGMLDDGNGVDVTAGDGIYTGTATVDSDAGWGDYTVTITATDAKGNDAVDTSLILAVRTGATGIEIDLDAGWNLISLPLIPDDSDISVVISASTLTSENVSSVGIVRGYDLATGEFPAYIPGTGGDLTTMEDGVGYWVFMEEADILTITGSQWPAPPAVPPTYDVVVGWNLIGFKSIESMPDYFLDIDAGQEGGYLANIAGTYPVLWSYDAFEGAYVNVKGLENGMEVGHGFWIWINEPGTIVPPGPLPPAP